MGNGSAGGSPGSNEPSTSRPPDAAVVVVADELLDVDAAVAQRATFAIRFGDLGLEGNDALQAVLHHLLTHLPDPHQ